MLNIKSKTLGCTSCFKFNKTLLLIYLKILKICHHFVCPKSVLKDFPAGRGGGGGGGGGGGDSWDFK